jgi:hypothetical protein
MRHELALTEMKSFFASFSDGKLLSDLRFRKITISMLILANFLVIAFLIFWKSPHLGLGDDGIYIRAGQRLASQGNLYQDSFRSGPLGAIFLFGLWKMFPAGIAWIVFQLIYVSSVAAISLLLTKSRTIEIRLCVTLFAITAAPMREHLHNHQITALVIFLCMWPFFLERRKPLFILFGAASCAIAIDLKPHLALIIILALSIYSRVLMMPMLAISFLILSHLVISLYSGRNISAEYISFLFDLSSSNEWGESVHLWPLFEKLNVNQDFLHILEYASVALVLGLILWSAFKRNMSHVLILISLLTYLLSYAHFYDLILLCILVTIVSMCSPSSKSVIFMGFAIMPGGILVLQNFIFWALMFGLYIYLINGVRSYTLAIAFVPALHFSIQLVNDFVFTSADHEIRFRTFIFVLLSLFLFVDSKARSVVNTR